MLLNSVLSGLLRLKWIKRSKKGNYQMQTHVTTWKHFTLLPSTIASSVMRSNLNESSSDISAGLKEKFGSADLNEKLGTADLKGKLDTVDLNEKFGTVGLNEASRVGGLKKKLSGAALCPKAVVNVVSAGNLCRKRCAPSLLQKRPSGEQSKKPCDAENAERSSTSPFLSFETFFLKWQIFKQNGSPC